MYALELTVTSREGALLRVLGLAERRGYIPIRMGVEARDEETYDVSLDVASSRPVELLVRQLSRLLEVTRVEVRT